MLVLLASGSCSMQSMTMRQTKLPTRDLIRSETPLRLSVAAALAFPDGSMTASGLRREAARDRLVVERIAGKDYTTLGNIERMRQLCRVEAKVPDCGSTGRRDEKGRITRRAVYVIRDGSIKRSTGFGEGEIEQAQRALANYQIARYSAPRVRDRDPALVSIADVISIYAEDVAAKHARPRETAARFERLLDFFGNESLLYLNRRTCLAYARQRRSEAVARRELEDLRAAIR
jgi:hypothetical protein